MLATSRSNLLRLAGVAVTAAGVFALFLVLAPTIYGQSNRTVFNDFFQLRSGSLIGASLRDVDDADVKREKLTGLAGAVVEEVTSGGPAAKAGFKAGDIVVNFDGEAVRSARHLTRLIEETPAGREVPVTVVRAGERVNMKVIANAAPGTYTFHYEPNNLQYRLANRDFSNILSATRLNNFPSGYTRFFFGRNRLGADVQELTGQLGEYFGASSGVLVTSVEDNTPGKTAGLKAGDVITRINGTAVSSPNELQRLLSTATGEVTITVVRDKREQTLKTKMEDDPVEAPRVIRRGAR
jgi:serine protease Do